MTEPLNYVKPCRLCGEQPIYHFERHERSVTVWCPRHAKRATGVVASTFDRAVCAWERTN